METLWHIHRVALHPLFSGQIRISKCWFYGGRKQENQEKTLEAGTRTNNKLNPHMAPTLGFEPQSHTGGRRVLSPLHHPCSPDVIVEVNSITYHSLRWDASLLACSIFQVRTTRGKENMRFKSCAGLTLGFTLTSVKNTQK